MLNPNQEHAKLFWIYILFAFLITLIREIVKDIEDIKGDVAQQCKTIPLVWGITTAKKIIYGLLLTLFIFLFTVGFYFFKSNPILVSYFFIVVFIPMCIVAKKMMEAQTSIDFHRISSYVKWITLLGILSMILL
jgi:4-hydroxybenzoate polyprenyltransferase